MRTIPPNKILESLEWSLVTHGEITDSVTRRMIQAEADTLRLALRSGESKRIAAATVEAVRVAEMYGVVIR